MIQSSEAKDKEYEILRTEILQYMEEYQTVRNMMYVVTGTVLGLNGSIWDNRYLFLIPLVVILPSYIIFCNYMQSVIVASVYMRVFLEDECIETIEEDDTVEGDLTIAGNTTKEFISAYAIRRNQNEDPSSYRWEGRHQKFSDRHDKDNLIGIKGWLFLHAQRIPYYVCAALCMTLFGVSAWSEHCSAKVIMRAEKATTLPFVVDVAIFVALSLLSLLLFVCTRNVNLENIRDTWNKIKKEEINENAKHKIIQ